MAIDIRADVTCSLGTVISGSLGDDYLQGSGLIKTQGSVLISGLITPAIGTIVTFTYTKQGTTRDIPRKMRVMSSFADPFRRTTQVELGCKLTYLSDLRESINWSALDDPENGGLTEEDAAIVTLPIFAKSVVRQCLQKLGIVADSVPLESSFSIPEFDFSSGYVDILGGLLVSESYFGFLDKNEVLRVKSLRQSGDSGPVFTSSDIVDIGPIGVGSLPGEAVTVSYSTLILSVPTIEEATEAGGGGEEDPPGGVEPPEDPEDPELTEEEQAEAQDQQDELQRINWEINETSSTPQKFYVSYTKGQGENEVRLQAVYTGSFGNITETAYIVIKVKKAETAGASQSEEDESSSYQNLFLIGSAVFPGFFFLGNTGLLTPEQQAEFETNPESVLSEVWPDAEKYDYVADGADDWVYNGSGWDLNPPTPNERFETEPESVLSEFFPLAMPYDYVSDGTVKWISSGSGWTKDDPLEESETEEPQESRYEEKEVPSIRKTVNTGPSISVLSSAAQQYLQNGIDFNNVSLVLSTSTEQFSYDAEGNQSGSTRTTVQSDAAVLGAAAMKWADSTGYFVFNYGGAVTTEKVIQSSETTEGYTRETTSTYLLHSLTQDGQQAIANATEDATIFDMPLIAGLITDGGLSHSDTTTTTSRRGITTSQSRPPQAIRNNNAYAKKPTGEPRIAGDIGAKDQVPPGDTGSSGGGSGEDESVDPNNGYSTQSESKMVLALGSAAAERRIEFSLPYAPDDRFSGPSGGPFFSVRSDAPGVAMKYGRVQNRLLLGNRNGISMQIAPERMPVSPFRPITVEANGLSALYRVNGASWAFDANGIVASMDALFWGAIGGTGDFWFPVAPGIVSLPENPTVVDTTPNQILGTVETVGSIPQTVLNTAFPDAVAGDGVQEQISDDFWTYNGTIWSNVGPTPGPTATVATVVLPYNETSIYSARIRSIVEVVKFTYSLQLLTDIGTIAIKSRLSVNKVVSVTTLTLTCLVPSVTTDTALLIPIIDAAMVTRRPYINNLKISVPAVAFNLLALTPGSGDVVIAIPSATSTIQAPVPSVYTEVNVGAITYSQSSVYTGTTPVSVAIMTDGTFTNTGSATNSGTDEWVQMDLGAVISISNIIIGTATDNIPGGWDRTYTENRDIEYSEDATSWTLAFNTDTFAADGIYTFAVNIKARYIRITTAVLDWTAISEFYALAPGQSYP